MTGHHLAPESLHTAKESYVHRLSPPVKVACTLAFVLAVVATPVEAVWAFGLDAVLILAAATAAQLPWHRLARRLTIEVPFVLFALALPFIGSGDRIDLLGVSLSVAGCWAAWGILAKGTLGVAACVVLAWSTPVPDLIAGLERLRVPRVLTLIAGFMVRYLDVIVGELRRLQIARVSRADDPRWLWQGRALAATAGTLFVRSFERGERVHQSMIARGFDGTIPPPSRPETTGWWWPALMLPGGALAIAVVASLGAP